MAARTCALICPDFDPLTLRPSAPVAPGDVPTPPRNLAGAARGNYPETGRARRFRPAPPPALSLAERRRRSGQPLVSPGGNLSPGYLAAKRICDVAGALGLLLLLGPVMLAIYLLLLVTMRGKALYIRRRAGYLGREFPMLKFRTMQLDADRLQHSVVNEQDGPVFKNRRDPRTTRLGRFLRKTSLDETPQLLNVLWGQMSLVGPRPLVVEEVAQLKAWQRGRLAVKPGLTCLWQVSGRSEIGFHDWVRMDLWYVRNQSLATDCKLLLHTPLSVLTGRGAY